jgi:G3E family GTPase
VRQEDIASVESTLRGPLPNVRLLHTQFADVPREILFGVTSNVERSGHDHHHHDDHDHDHGEEFAAWSWRSEGPLDRTAFRAALRRLPPTLLRAKGVLVFADRPEERAVFQLVGRRHALEVEKGPVPSESMLVAIARAGTLDAAALSALFDLCQRR